MRIPIWFSILCAVPLTAQRVEKVEPPDWWTGSSWTPVQLLIRGTELTGAQVKARPPLRADRVRSNERGTYLFVDLTIPRGAKPGKYPMTIRTSKGEVQAPFELVSPLSAQGRYQGISSDDVIYLIMPDRFANGDPSNDDPPGSHGLFDRNKPRYYHGGDLQGVITKLSYLKSLGVSAIWLNPWYDNVNHLNSKERYQNQDITDYHGYGAVDYYSVEEHFGDLRKLRELVDQAHALGIKVIQDQVANHTGPYHPWTTDPPKPTWYHGTPANHPDNDWQTWTLMDPNATSAVQRRTLDGWFINILPDMNQDDPDARTYLIQNSLWWVGRTGLDAIRQDTAPYVPRDFWRDWTNSLHREFPRLNVIGEVFDGDPAMTSFFQGGAKRFDGIDSGLHSVFDFPLFFAIRRAFAEGKPVKDVAQTLAHDYLYPDPNLLVTFAGLHDVSRFMGEKGATIDGLKLAFATLFAVRGVPMIYYGDEIGMAGGNDPDNRRDFPPSLDNSQQALKEWVSKLVAIRRDSVALRRGATRNRLASDQQWAFTRIAGNDAALVMINNSASAAPVDVSTELSTATLIDRLGSLGTVRLEDGVLRTTLPPRSASILVP